MPESGYVTARRSKGRIRILFVIPSLKIGGAEMQLLSLLQSLDKRKFAVHVAVFYRGNALDKQYEQSRDVQVHYLEKKSACDIFFLFRLYKVLVKHRFHIVQSYNISARFFGTITAKLAGDSAIIATERTARLLYSSAGSRVYLFFEKFAIRAADLLIANSQSGRDFARSRGVREDRIRVIYNGIDPSRLQVCREKNAVRENFSIPAHAFLIGMLARIEPVKDPFTFVRAAHYLTKKNPNFYFMLIGDGSLLPSVKAAVANSELTSRMKVTGFRMDTADVLSCMDVVVLTSKYVEGCSNALIEAMSLGKPVVATRVGGNIELIEHEKSGLLIAPAQPRELADAIERLYREPALRQHLAQNAQADAAIRFSQQAMVSAYEKLYRDLVRSRRKESMRA